MVKKLDNIKCDICQYQNHKNYVKISGVCHLCGNILDDRAYFRYQMNRRLKIWRADISPLWAVGDRKLHKKGK